MRRRMCTVLGAVSLAFATVVGPLAAASSAQQYPPSATTTCQVTATVVSRGGELGLSCAGMPADATVFVDLFSDPVRLGVFTTDASGRFNATVRIPRSTPPGQHRLQVTAVAPDGQRQQDSVMIMVAGDAQARAGDSGGGDRGASSGGGRGNLSRTGSSATAPLTAAAVALMGIGAVAVVMGRRRRLLAEEGDG